MMHAFLRVLMNRLLLRLAYILPGGGTIRPFLHRLRGVTLGRNAWISQFVYIDELHPEAIALGDNCTIGLRTAIFSHFYWGGRRPHESGKVTIEHDVFIGPCCVILPNVTIGRGAVIKAGTVVAKDVPAYTFWGLPSAEPLARVTIPLTSKTSYHEFLAGLRPVRGRRKKNETYSRHPDKSENVKQDTGQTPGTEGIPPSVSDEETNEAGM